MAYISNTTWVWSNESALIFDVTRFKETFVLRIILNDARTEQQFTRDELKILRDKIENALLDE